MIIEKYGVVQHQNDYYGKRVVCRNCGSRLIIQDDDCIMYDGKVHRHYLYLGDRIKFECPFCCDKSKDKASGVIYRNRFCEFLDKHDKLCAVIDWFEGYGVALLICLLVLAGLIFGIWWLIDTDCKLDEKYRLNIGIPFILVCIIYAICHYGPFICMHHEKKLPDIRTLNDKYEKVSAKRKHKAWLRIRSEIVHAAKHGNRHVQIWPEDYIDIPYDEFKGELESHGYVLEAHSKMWYRERVSIGVSWED